MRRGSRPIDRTRHAIEAMRLFRGDAGVEQRAREIDALPVVVWKGERLRTVRCHGTSGKGPHDVNVPEACLWALMDLGSFLCVYHPNDRETLKARNGGEGR